MQIVDNLHENTNEEPDIIPCSEISIQAFKDLVTKDAIILVSKWYDEMVVPRNKVQGYTS